MLRQAAKDIIAQVLYYSGMVKICRDLNKSVTILVYHGISYDKDHLNMNIPPNLFESQINYLKNNYKVISLDKAVEIINDKKIDANYCVITFDDGFKNNFDYALPILKKYSVNATIFVTYNSIENGYFCWSLLNNAVDKSTKTVLDLRKFDLGSLSLSSDKEKLDAIRSLHIMLKQLPNEKKKEIEDYIVGDEISCKEYDREMLNWSEIIEMIDTGLITIGAHTISHPILSKLPYRDAIYEIDGCKKNIESKIGVKVNHFAYPNGSKADFTDETINIIKMAGFKSSCTTSKGTNDVESDLYRLKRLSISCLMSSDTKGCFSKPLFSAKIAGLI